VRVNRQGKYSLNYRHEYVLKPLPKGSVRSKGTP